MHLSIIIVSWNVADLLKKCLTSIYKHTRGITYEIFLIDNNSSDDTVALVKHNFPAVKLIANQENKGFAVANNQGIKQAAGEYILLLNPDTELKEDSLSKMIEFMRANSNIGIAGCHLINSNGSHQDSVRRLPKFLDQTWILLKLHHIFPKFRPLGRYLCTDFDYKREQEADQVMGAFFMVKKEIFEQVGLLDENFYIWFEEVDFCQRAKAAGWLIVYTPITEIIHHFGRSFKQVMTVEKQKIWNKSLRYYFFKHSGVGRYLGIRIASWLALGVTYISSGLGQRRIFNTTKSST